MTIEAINDRAAPPTERVAALRALTEAGHGFPGLVEESNNHIHTIYSFSPYTPAMAALRGREAGLQVVGSVDHDSVAAAGEMREAAAVCGMGAVTGFEVRAAFHGSDEVRDGRAPFHERKLNNPDSPGVAYLVVHGIPAGRRAEADAFLRPIREARLERTRRMAEGANRILDELGVPGFDFERDVVGRSQYASGGTVTERHLLHAMSETLIEGFGTGRPLLEGLEAMGVGVPAKLAELLGDASNPFLAYDLLGVLKSEYLHRFYIQPTRIEDGGELPDARDVVRLALEVGAIPCYAYLGDVSASPTGDKKAEKFEDEYLDELMAALGDAGFPAVTFMPPRNTPEQLRRITDLAVRHGLIAVSGVDINQPRQGFNCPQLQRPEFAHLNTATWALVAHEAVSDADPDLGLLHPANPLAHLPLPQRVEVYGGLGPELVAGAAPGDVAERLRRIRNTPMNDQIVQLRGCFLERLRTPVVLRPSDDAPQVRLGGDPDGWGAQLEDVRLPAVVGVGDRTVRVEALPGARATIDPRDPGAGSAAGRESVVAGRIALVTGGAQGFGEEIVRGLHASGAWVFIADLNLEKAAELAGELGDRATALACNVADEESVAALADAIVQHAGGLDLVVSNAGIARAGSVLEQDLSEFALSTDVNYKAFFLVTKHMGRILRAQAATAPSWTTDIVQINSKSGLVGSNRNAAYAGSKFGGIGLVQSFALELVDHHVKVNAICPGNFLDGPLWSDPENGLFVQYLRSGKVPGATTVEEVRESYEAKVPMRRGATGPDVLRALYYIVEQTYETGQAVPVTGGQVMLSS